MSLQSDLAKIRKQAEEQGWRVAKSQHWWLFFWPGIGPDEKPCQIGTTPHTKGRSLENFKSCLRRHGFQERR